MKVRYTVAALADLAAIRAYIAKDAPINAKRFIAKIRAAVNRLKLFPASGAVVEDWDREETRELFVGNYRVVYWLGSPARKFEFST